MDSAIKFTFEGNKDNGAIPFLDTLVEPEADYTLSLTVYRKPMHTDQYLQCESHHNLAAKGSVISTLAYRVRSDCTKPELLNHELQHCRKALTRCKYTKWALDMVERKFINTGQEDSNAGNTQGEPSEQVSNNPSNNNTGSDMPKINATRGT